VQIQTHQKIKPYQQLRYGSNVPFPSRNRSICEVFGFACSDNPARPLQRSNRRVCKTSSSAHLKEDGKMSRLIFGVQSSTPTE